MRRVPSPVSGLNPAPLVDCAVCARPSRYSSGVMPIAAAEIDGVRAAAEAARAAAEMARPTLVASRGTCMCSAPSRRQLPLGWGTQHVLRPRLWGGVAGSAGV
eukprot:1585089-Prymnesium_polylepis.2